ncbi:MAG: hypothetical protein KDD22_01945 [Bdellovibrionales bacterium]|nr:hypothetical protein [Bdellovibrionales bacterium]
MLEIVNSQQGTPVVCWQGLALASMKNPVRAAEHWVIQNTSAVKNCDTVIILGLGCGYHVVEFLKVFPEKSVVVLEHTKELVDYCGRQFPMELAAVNVIQCSNVSHLITMARIEAALKKSYCVIEHVPSCVVHRQFYIDIACLLRGREPNGIREHLALRERYRHLFNESDIVRDLPNAVEANELISIHHLDRWMKPNEKWTQGGLMLQVLKELVK